MILWWCRQADERGLLQGDVNHARGIAKDICLRMSQVREKRMDSVLVNRIDSIIDLWMSLSYPNAYEQHKAAKLAEAANEGSNTHNLLAPDMASMLDRLRRVASMETDDFEE